ncbi:mechanosensitive ion channel family protein [Bacteroidota bacterium]
MKESLGDIIRKWLIELGINDIYAGYFKNAIILIAIILLSIIVYYITKRIIIQVLKRIAKKTKFTWDDVLIEKRVFHKLAYLVPAIILHALVPSTIKGYDIWINILQSGLKIYIIIIILLVISAFLNALNQIYQQEFEFAKSKPIKGYIQIINIIAYVIGIILMFSIIINRSPITLFAGLGAISAVLLLVFKDSILGFVASIQLSANDMVRIGDWIAMQKYGADGTVQDINLTNVKVQNWDKTISTIPTYALISDSVQNWRGMEESGGRRIKRSININMNSVKFCTEEMLERFKKIHRIKDYVIKKQEELDIHNQKNNIDNSILVNGRRQTNIGIFRAYLEAYLFHNPNIKHDMTFMVRQLPPSEKGIPIEIYVFSKVQEWIKYEQIQSDIFDHILAVIPQFDLQVFQEPTGMDFHALSGNTN